MFDYTSSGRSKSLMSNPLSAITLSPFSSEARRPDCLVSCISEILPEQREDTKQIAPEGVIPINDLKVLPVRIVLAMDNILRVKTLRNKLPSSRRLQFLLSLEFFFITRKSHLLLCRIRRLHNFNLGGIKDYYCCGVLLLKTFRHMLLYLSTSWPHKKFTRVIKIRDTVEGCTPNQSAKSSSNNPTLRRQSVIINSSMGDTLRCGPHFNSR